MVRSPVESRLGRVIADRACGRTGRHPGSVGIGWGKTALPDQGVVDLATLAMCWENTPSCAISWLWLLAVRLGERGTRGDRRAR
ncbi:hypothetical protein SAMN05444320_104105 [Streptoalloteichus hindustanus]|uniref:Uncharacterized protein n=1 Tax=Streptoalloteichus hindustanus TaxID=2017 RepID=A0A1M5CNY4_STRHI|nr:hypothetical protein SAMN05444320_104105 [Streptoalloteichus hindustanus]